MRRWLQILRRRQRIGHLAWRLTLVYDPALEAQLAREQWALQQFMTYPPNKAGSR